MVLQLIRGLEPGQLLLVNIIPDFAALGLLEEKAQAGADTRYTSKVCHSEGQLAEEWTHGAADGAGLTGHAEGDAADLGGEQLGQVDVEQRPEGAEH